jgi:predicted Zn-dependent protease with MMP-like domain
LNFIDLMSALLQKLQSIAQTEVEATLAALPEPLRRQAAPLPVTYQARPDKLLMDDGCDSDLLGLFVGAALAEPGDSPLPPQIILFLENLWDLAQADEEFYREEIRTTYLHELGHYLGLDEIDLEERGLE